MFKREKLLQKMLKWRDQDIIKVLTGMRRAGKSTLMEMYQAHLLSSGIPQSNIVYLNFERRECWGLDTCAKVFDEIDRRLTGDGKKYVFLDELQRISGFEKLIDALYADKRFDTYITGSNAYMLSGELATLLSGRYVEIHVTPLSFAEFVQGSGKDTLTAWREYTKYGSLPYVRRLLEDGHALEIGDYLEGVYNTVLVKDVVTRVKMSDVGTVEKIASFLFDNISNLTNVKRIADTLASTGGKGSYQSVNAYVRQLCEAYLFYACDRLDARGLDILKVGTKYYASDIGLRYLLNGNRTGDDGCILENIVYLELARRHRNVFTGALRNGHEIDFVVRDGDEVAYYQVADSVKTSETLERELRPLRELNNDYPKYLIVGDYSNPVMHNGIRQMCVQDFLLESAK